MARINRFEKRYHPEPETHLHHNTRFQTQRNNRLISFLLSLLIAIGSLGTLPALAADQAVEPDICIEPSDEASPLDIEAEIEPSEAVPAEESYEEAEYAPEEELPAAEEDEPVALPTDAEQTDAVREDAALGTVSDENEPFVLHATFTLNLRSHFIMDDETDEWFYYSTLYEACEDGYQDDYYKPGNDDDWFDYDWDESGESDSEQSPFASIFSGTPRFTVGYYAKDAFVSIGNSSDYVDLTRTYVLLVTYQLRDGYTPSSDSVIMVNDSAVEWTVTDGYLSFFVPVLEGRTLPLGVFSGSKCTLIAGDQLYLEGYVYEYGGKKITSASSSNSSVVKITDEDYFGKTLLCLKPGTATVTVKGKNGSVDKCAVTVKSFLKSTSITVNSLSTKNVGLQLVGGDDEWDCNDVDDYTWSFSKKDIVTVSRYYGDFDDSGFFKIKGKYPGQTTITFKGQNGETSTLKVTVKPALSNTTKTPTVVYGATSITSYTTPGAKVSTKIGTKTYTATANASGKYTLKTPIVKIGTKINLKFTSAGTSLTKTITVKKCTSKVETTYWTYRDSKTVRGKATKVHKGDYIKVTINGKTYKKSFTKDANSTNFTISIKKPGKYGIKFTTELYNKYNQRLAIETEYIYKSDTVYKGDSKSTVKWLTGWNDPVKKIIRTNTEQWCYDWDGDGYYDAYLYFKNDKVTGWTVYE